MGFDGEALFAFELLKLRLASMNVSPPLKLTQSPALKLAEFTRPTVFQGALVEVPAFASLPEFATKYCVPEHVPDEGGGVVELAEAPLK